MIKENEKREHIIKNLRRALLNKNTIKTVFHETMQVNSKVATDDSAIVFVENFIKSNGIVLYSTSEEEIKLQMEHILCKYPDANISCSSDALTQFFNSLGLTKILPASLATNTDICILPCESIIANNMSALVSTGQGNLLFPKILIIFAFTSQAVYSWKEATARLKSQYINKLPEKVMLLDLHDPKFESIYVLLNED